MLSGRIVSQCRLPTFMPRPGCRPSGWPPRRRGCPARRPGRRGRRGAWARPPRHIPVGTGSVLRPSSRQTDVVGRAGGRCGRGLPGTGRTSRATELSVPPRRIVTLAGRPGRTSSRPRSTSRLLAIGRSPTRTSSSPGRKPEALRRAPGLDLGDHDAPRRTLGAARR